MTIIEESAFDPQRTLNQGAGVGCSQYKMKSVVVELGGRAELICGQRTDLCEAKLKVAFAQFVSLQPDQKYRIPRAPADQRVLPDRVKTRSANSSTPLVGSKTIRSSFGLKSVMVSLPLTDWMMNSSEPRPPVITSLPLPPYSMSSPLPPTSVSSPPWPVSALAPSLPTSMSLSPLPPTFSMPTSKPELPKPSLTILPRLRST